jgi:diacylglycerol kinase
MSLKKRIHSFKYAFAGLADLFRSQPNARIHLVFTILVLLLGGYFKISTTEWSLLLICISLVLSMEALNTAIEHLTDLVSPDYHPLAGKAKDVAAAAVLLAAFGAIIVGLIVFLPKVLSLF